jgi:hypothetical protein
MMSRRLRCASIAVALCAVTMSAQQSAPPPSFRFERPIVSDGAGPRRLAIDVPLLVGTAPARLLRGSARGDLVRDLRIYDANGAEIGYVLAGDPPIAPVYKPAVMLPIATVDTRTERTSGFEADLGEPTLVDRLITSIRRSSRLKLEGSGDRERWTLRWSPKGRCSISRTRSCSRPNCVSRRHLPLSRVTWDDRQSARIARMPAAAAGQAGGGAETAAGRAAGLRAPSERAGRSRFRVRLPAANPPDHRARSRRQGRALAA